MATSISDTVFKSSSPGDKARHTDEAARAIISAEANASKAKTARLRQLRLEKEAAEPEPAPKKTRARRTPAR